MSGMPRVRVLLIEDFEPFRRFVRLTLESREVFEVVGEAVDGLEAVQLAKTLQPNLILIDIGLPKLNGITAAEQIGFLAPNAKLLFVSLESSPAAVQAAFRAGAHGYVHKLSAQDLIPAVEAVLAGKRFVSSRFEFSDTVSVPHRHEVQFYSNEMVFVESASRFVGDALKTDGAAIVVVTAAHRNSILDRLKANAFNIDRAVQQGTYSSLDVNELLSEVMVNGLVDHDRFSEILGGVVESANKARKSEQSRIAIFGECAGLLCAEGNNDAALQLERKGNERPISGVDIMCAYPLSAFDRADGRRTFKSVCAEHTSVFSH